MKKIIASAGMVAVGVTGLQAVNYGDLTPEQASKRWSVSAAVRGFYDDNYTTRPSGPLKRDSFGFQVSPSASLNLPMETSFLSASYIYTMSYYEDRADDKIDQSHDLRVVFDHRLTERYRFNLMDQFVYSVEPTLLSQDGAGVPLRFDAEAIHNRAVLTFDAQLTRQWSLLLGYENNYWNYLDDGTQSYSALLDRVEHLFRIDPKVQLLPNTKAFFGYQFGYNDYTSDELLSFAGTFRGTDRDSISHYAYVGAEHQFSSVLSVEGRVGVTYTDYIELDETDWSPYADIFGTYTYLPGSTLKAGIRQSHNATDVAVDPSDPTSITLDQDTTTLYASVNHRITPMLTAGLLAQYQHSVYNGGTADGEADDYFSATLHVAYKLSHHWSVEANYSIDHLSSDLDERGFTRNRIMAGVRATF